MLYNDDVAIYIQSYSICQNTIARYDCLRVTIFRNPYIPTCYVYDL